MPNKTMTITISVPDRPPINTKPSVRWIWACFTDDPDSFTNEGRKLLSGPSPWDYEQLPMKDLDTVWHWLMHADANYPRQVRDALSVLHLGVDFCPDLQKVVDDIKKLGLHWRPLQQWHVSIMQSVLDGYAEVQSEACNYEASVLFSVLKGDWND